MAGEYADVLSQPTMVGYPFIGASPESQTEPPDAVDIYDAGRGRVIGTVKEKGAPTNIPLHRRVVLLSMPGSRAMRETWSDPASGAYEFRGVDMNRRYTVISYDHTGAYRAVIADNIQPEQMP